MMLSARVAWARPPQDTNMENINAESHDHVTGGRRAALLRIPAGVPNPQPANPERKIVLTNQEFSLIGFLLMA